MAPILKARHASFVTDDGEVTYNTGPLPDDVPADHLSTMRDAGMLAEGDEPTALDVTNAGPAGVADLDAPGHVDPDPDLPAPPGDPAQPVSDRYEGAQTGDPSGSSTSGSSGQSADLPDDAPDATTADVATLAAYIDEQNLNAAQTVALAGDSPEGAAKVIEAEQTSSGGDGRTTVVGPLTKQAEAGSG